MVFCFSGLLLSLLPPVTAQMMTQTLGDRRQGRAASFAPQMTYLPTLCSQDILGSFLAEEIDVLFPSTHDYNSLYVRACQAIHRLDPGGSEHYGDYPNFSFFGGGRGVLVEK